MIKYHFFFRKETILLYYNVKYFGISLDKTLICGLHLKLKKKNYQQQITFQLCPML